MLTGLLISTFGGIIKMKKISLVICFIALLCGCTRDKETVITSAGYPKEIGNIITYRCANAGCHTTQNREIAGGLDLSTWAHLFEGSDDGTPVVAYAADFSYLLYCVNTYADL